jgi:hypothetical protein
MTCEVAVMNKYAVVIAADSAVTNTDNNGAERYSKGGNKIFQLSHFEPVGVMIFGTSALSGVPWEIIIKGYRDALEKQKFATLGEYSASFFDYVKQAAHFFPPADLEQRLLDHVSSIALQLLDIARTSSPDVFDDAKPMGDRQQAWANFVAAEQAKLAAVALDARIDAESYEEALNSVPPKLVPLATITSAQLQLTGIVDEVAWLSLACDAFFKRFKWLLNTTGIVFSGYGDNQYFPEVIEYGVSGFVGRSFIFEKNSQNSGVVSHDAPSAIFQFAMTSEVEAFTTGLGLDTFSIVNAAYRTFSKKLVSDVLSQTASQAPGDLDDVIEANAKEFTGAYVNEVYANHYHPMKRVIAMLPVDEMVHLAETMVVLQSLKERVTTPKQSVGGPIDVAVITKSEGLVWIKRKHFFDSDKNLRFVMRQKSLYS